MNWGKITMKLWQDKRKVNIKYLRSTNTYSHLWHQGAIPGWSVSVKDQVLIDAYLECLLVPMGCSSEFKIRAIFQQTSYLNGSNYLNFFTIIIPLVISVVQFKDQYRYFYKMLSDDTFIIPLNFQKKN